MDFLTLPRWFGEGEGGGGGIYREYRRLVACSRNTTAFHCYSTYDVVSWRKPNKTPENNQQQMLTVLLLTLQVGARSLETAVWGAFYNVKINLQDITEETYKKEVS